MPICSACGKEVEEVCVNCWRCAKCVKGCTVHMKRVIDGSVHDKKKLPKRKI